MRVTVLDLQQIKNRGERFPVITAYDYPTARLVDECGIPVILVGDSLGTVVLGYETTLQVTLEDILRHTQAVVRGSQRAMVVADMPFMTYQVSVEDALRNAARLIQEGGAQAVKLEGGERSAQTIRRLVETGVPVMGHVGLTPQSFNVFGGNKLQGKSAATAELVMRDADAVQEAGAFSVVLEGIPAPLAQRITERLQVPTIGIGAGVHCTAQVQVIYDMLGLYTDFHPRHVKRFAQLAEVIQGALERYRSEVTSGAFPTPAESFSMDEKALRELDSAIGRA